MHRIPSRTRPESNTLKSASRATMAGELPDDLRVHLNQAKIHMEKAKMLEKDDATEAIIERKDGLVAILAALELARKHDDQYMAAIVGERAASLAKTLGNIHDARRYATEAAKAWRKLGEGNPEQSRTHVSAAEMIEAEYHLLPPPRL